MLSNDSDPDGDPLSIADVDAGSDAVAIDPSGAISFEPPLTLGGARPPGRVVRLRGRRRTRRHRPGAGDGRGRRVDRPDRADRRRRHRRTVPRGQGLTINVLANDSDPDGRVADLTVRSDDALLPIAADGTLTIADAAGHGAPRVHDHRRRRPRSDGRGDRDRARQRRTRGRPAARDDGVQTRRSTWRSPRRRPTPTATPSRSPAVTGSAAARSTSLESAQGRDQRAVHARRRTSSASAASRTSPTTRTATAWRASRRSRCNRRPTRRRWPTDGTGAGRSRGRDTDRPRASSSPTPT